MERQYTPNILLQTLWLRNKTLIKCGGDAIVSCSCKKEEQFSPYFEKPTEVLLGKKKKILENIIGREKKQFPNKFEIGIDWL